MQLNFNQDGIAYIVMDENTLGYVYASHPSWMHVLAGSVLRGGRDPLYGPVHITGVNTIRNAELADFDTFWASPRGHLAPLSACA